MTHLSVSEWGRVPVGEGGFTRAEANLLTKAARAHPLGGEEGTAILVDHYRHLSARQMVGVIAAPGCSLEILPKVDPADREEDAVVRRRLVRMLDIALGLDLSNGAAANMARQDESLLDILIRLFADQLLAETRRGLPRNYIDHCDDLATLRGRLDIRRQFTANAIHPHRLACRYDVLSADGPLLQIMKTCVRVLRHHVRLGETRRTLEELLILFAEVTDIAPRALPWQKVHIDRGNKRWAALYRLARLFLKREWQATHQASDAAEGITLLFPMNDLFEGYVAALANRAMRGTGLSVESQSGRLFCLTEEGENGRRRFQTRPDIIVRRGEEAVMIIDTKWKKLQARIDDAKQGVHQADVYQMMAYGRLYACRQLLLLYPHHASLGPSQIGQSYRITNSEDRLGTATIDIAKGDSVAMARLAEIVANGAVSSPSPEARVLG